MHAEEPMTNQGRNQCKLNVSPRNSLKVNMLVRLTPSAFYRMTLLDLSINALRGENIMRHFSVCRLKAEIKQTVLQIFDSQTVLINLCWEGNVEQLFLLSCP